MIKLNIGDYIVVQDFEQRCICKLVSIGRESEKIRSVSVRLVEPTLFREAFRITINMEKIDILTEDQAKVVRLLYE